MDEQKKKICLALICHVVHHMPVVRREDIRIDTHATRCLLKAARQHGDHGGHIEKNKSRGTGVGKASAEKVPE